MAIKMTPARIPAELMRASRTTSNTPAISDSDRARLHGMMRRDADHRMSQTRCPNEDLTPDIHQLRYHRPTRKLY